MTISFIRSFFIIVSSVVGYYIGSLLELNKPMIWGSQTDIFGAMIGCLCGLVLIFIEMQLKRVSVRGLSSLLFGLVLGVMMAKLLANIFALLPLSEFTLSVSEIVLTLIFSYLGAVMALRGKDEFNLIIPYVRFKRQNVYESVIILDTSAIIDGRIADIYRSHFISGRLLVPKSVLLELQALADAENDIKRQKGRRGLDILTDMQNDANIDIQIHEDELNKEQLVDTQLVVLARMMDASLCTTDYNLSQVAVAQGVQVLNLNNLVAAIKPVIFSGQELEVQLIKEGKESDQAVAYMEDGTMVVVTGARDCIGEKKMVDVTSVLQTQAGRMIFAKLNNGQGNSRK